MLTLTENAVEAIKSMAADAGTPDGPSEHAPEHSRGRMLGPRALYTLKQLSAVAFVWVWRAVRTG
ncbi:hypothetical protein [Nonomuraea turkmeniaca]|uniref:hypothetical protein n=1 Tax=Nonomuraea turkmeniaca TaxID=103838 RepID=UPI001FE8A29F|nr:hypothetical protein [Nonomuraea turkmeniaca]